MFSKLTNYKLKRTAIQALGFYIAYLLLLILVGGVSAALLGLFTGNEDSFEFGIRIGNIVAILGSLYLTYSVANAKGQMKDFSGIVLIVLSGLFAAFGGGLLGLIPAAYLTTKK